MKIFQSIKMAWRSIKGKKSRSILTILSIFIGIAAVMTIVSVMEGMKEYTRQQYASMGSNKITIGIYSYYYGEFGEEPPQTDYFPKFREYCLAHPELIAGVSPQGYCNATVKYGTVSTDNIEWSWDDQGNQTSAPPNRYYVSDQYALINDLSLARGREISYLDVEKYNQVATLGAQAAKTFFGTSNPVGQTIQVGGHNFEVIGVYASTMTGDNAPSFSNNDNFVLLPYSVRRTLGDSTDNNFYAKAVDSNKMKDAMASLSGFAKGLVGNNGGYNVYSENTWIDYENEQIAMIGLVLGGIAAISLLVGGIGIMNMMLVTVTERTKEIGIRRAIGAQKNSIVFQFLIESGMLCGIGGLVGILIGTIGSLVIGYFIFHIIIWPSIPVAFGAFLLSVALGILFGSYPASKAAKLQPVDALRAE